MPTIIQLPHTALTHNCNAIEHITIPVSVFSYTKQEDFLTVHRFRKMFYCSLFYNSLQRYSWYLFTELVVTSRNRATSLAANPMEIAAILLALIVRNTIANDIEDKVDYSKVVRWGWLWICFQLLKWNYCLWKKAWGWGVSTGKGRVWWRWGGTREGGVENDEHSSPWKKQQLATIIQSFHVYKVSRRRVL